MLNVLLLVLLFCRAGLRRWKDGAKRMLHFPGVARAEITRNVVALHLSVRFLVSAVTVLSDSTKPKISMRSTG